MRTKNTKQTIDALRKAGTPFTEERILSNGFRGTRLVFKKRSEARQAEKVTGHEVTRYFEHFSITLY